MAVVLPFDRARGILKPGGPQTTNPAYFAVPNGLIGYWGFDPDCLDFTNNLAFDLSGNGKTGTLVGATKPTLAMGKVGHALQFNSSGVKLGNVFNIGTGDFSVGAWFNTSSAATQGIIAKSALSGAASRWGLVLNDTFKLEFVIEFADATNRTFGTNNAYATNIWHHALVSLDRAGFGTLYVNGVVAATGDISPEVGAAFTSAFDCGIGAYEDASGNFSATTLPFIGAIDDVRIYNRRVDPWEVIQIHQSGLAGRRNAGDSLPMECEMVALAGGSTISHSWIVRGGMGRHATTHNRGYSR